MATSYSSLNITEKPEYISKLEDDTFMMERTLYPLESMVTTEVITGLLSQSKVEKKYNAFDKDIAVIHFYFGKASTLGKVSTHYSLSPSEYERSLRMSIFNLIANFGGIFGLFLGFSIVSFLEILYWTTVGLASNCAR